MKLNTHERWGSFMSIIIPFYGDVWICKWNEYVNDKNWIESNMKLYEYEYDNTMKMKWLYDMK